MTVLLAGVLAVSLTSYALLAGADFGGGLWDLLATGPTADRQRHTIARAIGPVWEANHVWLIVTIVVLFAGFPRAFSTLGLYFHVPLALALVGIILRGAAFVFRAYGAEDVPHARRWGRVFAIASILTPMLLGIVLGGITDGAVPAQPSGRFYAVFVSPWLTAFSLCVGAFGLTLCGFLAAVYLTLEADDGDVRMAFRQRALASGVAVGVLALVVLILAPAAVRHALVLSAWALPLHAATAAAAIAALVCLWRERYHSARILAAAQVSFVVVGWALAQYPYAIRPDLTLADAAAPASVQRMLLIVLAGGLLVLTPSLAFLFRLFGPRGR